MTEALLQVPALKDFLIRPPKLSDAKAAADLANIVSQALIGINQAEPVDFETVWQSPGFDKEASVRLIFDSGGLLVGVFTVRDNNAPYVRIGVNMLVHPDSRYGGMPEAMLAWVEARARLVISKAPEGVQVVMAAGANQIDTWKKGLFEGHGMEIIRHFLRMEIDLGDTLQLPVIPEGITLRPYHPEKELKKVALIYQDSFQDHFGFTEEPMEKMLEELTHWISNDPDHDPELWMVAANGERLAGLAICTPRMVEDDQLGYVYILGVGRGWRGRGLGLALLQHAFMELYKKGCKRVGLEVDASSLTGATRLYKKAGMSVTRQYDSFSKILREGEDITTTSLE